MVRSAAPASRIGLADLQAGRVQRRPAGAVDGRALQAEAAEQATAGHPDPAGRGHPVQVERAADVQVVRGQRPAVRVLQPGPAERQRADPGADQPDRTVRPAAAHLDAAAEVHHVGDVQAGRGQPRAGRVGQPQPAPGQPAGDPGTGQLDGARRRRAGADRIVEQQVAAERDPVGDQRRPGAAGQHRPRQVELPADPRADEAHQPVAGEPAPEQHRAVDHGVVGEQSADRAATEVEQRQRRAAQHEAGQRAVAQPEPDPGLQAVEVEAADQRRAAYLQPTSVDRPVLAEQDVADHAGAQLALGGGAQVQRLAGHGRLDQAPLEVAERRHGAEG